MTAQPGAMALLRQVESDVRTAGKVTAITFVEADETGQLRHSGPCKGATVRTGGTTPAISVHQDLTEKDRHESVR
jgi:hypothetical protein